MRFIHFSCRMFLEKNFIFNYQIEKNVKPQKKFALARTKCKNGGTNGQQGIGKFFFVN